MNKTKSGIFCPACKMRNEPGAILCSYCNTPLNNSQKTISLSRFKEVTAVLDSTIGSTLDMSIPDKERFMDFELPAKGIALINIENGKPLAIREERAFILGRASADIQTQHPLVDLTPYKALEMGISRVHAMLQKTKHGYEVIDLNSSNGTWLESQRLVPQRLYPLESGSRLRLARMNILVFYPGT